MSENSSKTGNGAGIFVERRFGSPTAAGGIKKTDPKTAGSPATMAHLTTGVATTGPSGAAAVQLKPSTLNIEKSSLPYFDGLLDFDEVLEHWSKKMTMFVNQVEKECQFNFWSGLSLTGKTTLAKRLSGLEGFKMFDAGGVKVQYLDCFTLRDSFDKLKVEWLDLNKTPPNSVIFIDEFEKCVDASYKLVDEVFARKIRKYFEDITKSQKIMFVFLSDQKNDRATVGKLLDAKLTSITDFSLSFPDWTPERLTTLILKRISSRKLKISNMAAANLALHACQHTKYMEVQGVLPLLETELKISGKTEIDEELMELVLKGRR